VNARAPLKVLGRFDPRAERAGDGGLSGEAASVPQPSDVDEQISALLESVEVELREAGRPRWAGRPANVSTRTSSRPVARERATKTTLDLRPRTLARALTRRRAARKARDPVDWERVIVIIIAVMLGIGVGFAISLLLT
jgi:hypothetical protein